MHPWIKCFNSTKLWKSVDSGYRKTKTVFQLSSIVEPQLHFWVYIQKYCIFLLPISGNQGHLYNMLSNHLDSKITWNLLVLSSQMLIIHTPQVLICFFKY